MNRYNLIHLLIILFLALIDINFLDAQVTDTIEVEAGWNFLSLPLKVTDYRKNILFPSAVSDAFIFNGSYISKNTLENGDGFWLKFDSADIFFITGEAIHMDTISVHKGWNMVGSLTVPITPNHTWSEPYGIRVSGFYHYGLGEYLDLDTIKPGWGYWIQVVQEGKIFLSSIGSPCQWITAVEYASKIYSTVPVGSQCWLRENLDIGVMMQSIHTSTDNGIIEKYCYENDHFNCLMDGGLYQWNEAMQYTTSPGARGICPPGWHIPTMSEFDTLRMIVGGDGNKLKAIGYGTDSGAGTNTSGFNALLAGYRNNNGSFNNYYASTLFWCSTEHPWGAYYWGLSSSNSNISLDAYFKEGGFSVRCLKD